MDHERHQRVMELLESAVELPPEKRASFLAEQCGDDDLLRQEVESLLTSYSRSGSFLEAPIAMDEPTAARALVGTTIGRYLVKDILAVGGMGVVYRAEQQQPRREVALKLLRPGLATQRILKRFEHEAEILGRLSHPGIGKIIEAGTFDAGAGVQPYFAMELIDGESLTEFVVRRALDVDERLALMQRVCDAVQHAHLKGVVHRDLKPSNILVDQSGQPRILDFGIARLTDEDTSRMTMATETGQLLGTLAYMSPEQVAGLPDEVDARSDVYALGVLLYEVVAGGVPHEVSRHSIFEAARIIREEPPPRLRTAMPGVRDDVETIILKAMEKEKDRRYQSAGELGADIERYLSDEPILARGPSRMYQLRTFARRNRPLVAGVTATFAALVIGLMGTAYGLLDAVKAREIAELEARSAIEARDAEAQQRRLVEQREDELRNVVDFQSEILGQIDVAEMGAMMLRDLRDEVMAASRRAGTDDNAIALAIEDLNQLLRGVNMTNVAVKSLDQQLVRRATQTIEEQFADQPLVAASLLETVASIYSVLGQVDDGLQTQQRAVDLRLENHGRADRRTIHAMRELSILLRDVGRLEEAEHVIRETVALAREHLGEDDQLTLESSGTLGIVLRHRGNLTEAEDVQRSALDGFVRVFGEEHVETLNAMSNLGAVLRSASRFQEAESLYQRALEGQRRLLGEHDSGTLTTLGNLGIVQHRLGKLDEAEATVRAALEGRRTVFGDDHPTTLQAKNNLAVVLRWQNRHDEAIALYDEALETQRRTLGPEHPQTLQTQSNRATLLYQLGRRDESLIVQYEVLEARRRTLGDSHVETLHSMFQVARALYDLGRLDEAEHAIRTALDHHQSALGDDHRGTIDCLSLLAMILGHTGRPMDALPYYQEAYVRTVGLFGQRSRASCIAMANLAENKIRVGRYDDARELLELTIDIADEVLPPGDVRRVHYRRQLGTALSELERTDEAEQAFHEALAVCDSILQTQNIHCLQLVRHLVDLYSAHDRVDDGVALLNERLSMIRAQAEADHNTVEQIERWRDEYQAAR